MTERAGELVGGRYRLVEPIGQGAMGRVWRGHDEVLDREVAVKQVLFPYGLPEEQRESLIGRMLREARAAARLNHPGIVTVHDVVEHDGVPAIVMELLTGVSLGTAIEREGRLPPERVAGIGVAMLDALREAHAAGIVHRDLKPDNVLLAGRRIVITDFGIAGMADATALTVSGAVMGTPRYMAPEQIEGKPATAASDLWSLGATLYTAVEGRPPFAGPTLTSLYAAILTQGPRPPERAGPLTPALAGLLVKNPDDRATAEQTARALAWAMSALHSPPVGNTVPNHAPGPGMAPVQGTTTVPPGLHGPRPPGGHGLRRGVVLLGGLGAIALTGIAATMIWWGTTYLGTRAQHGKETPTASGTPSVASGTPSAASGSPSPANPTLQAGATSLAGTTWSGVDSDGDYYVFTFVADGHVKYRSPTGNWDNQEDRWSVNGSKLTIDMKGGYSIYEGTITGNTISGKAHNVTGRRWTWSLRKN
ncbi:protein kinase domain-containing protein [Actinomadura scrupuli]|uniref:serine/threonine-protein kinase n=1 Tax=Actinomadura scrupuli TaxID=559629 RepID=UPI003D984DD9